jgi:hypothetical protein
MLLRIILLLLLAGPLHVLAEDINAGFVRGFWYSSDTVFADTPTRVYVAIRNNTGADLSGTVTFYANDTRIGTQPVAALNNRIIESWVDWEPAYGEYRLRAELSRVKLSTVGEAAEAVDQTLGAATDTLFVDYDTDGDGQGNATDTDDDNDTMSDADETKSGSDPLHAEATTRSASDQETTVITLPQTTAAAPHTTTGGLERYLTPSRADTLLGSITAWASTTKATLDTYRAARDAARTTTPPPVTVNNDGFGAVTRSTDTQHGTTKPEHVPNGIARDAVTLIGKLLSGIMSLILLTISVMLGHALMLQLLLLISMLGSIYLVARKMGRRPLVVKKKK